MSILLDALKKSEAQRRLGETPTLQTSVSTDEGHGADRQHWIPLALIVLSAGIMTWTGIAQFRQDDSLPTSAELDGDSSGVVVAQSGTETIQAPGGAVEPKRKSTGIRPQVDNRKSATTPVQDYVVADPPPEPRVRQPANDVGEAVETINPEVAGQRHAAGAGGSGREGGSGSSSRVAHVEIGANPSAEENAGVGSREGSAAATPASGQQEVTGEDAYALQTISYWQVPQSLREEMGEFRISVLVYAENPADRFLLVNGSRLREQEETSGGVRLELIERDRAVFTYRNYRFHLKN